MTKKEKKIRQGASEISLEDEASATILKTMESLGVRGVLVLVGVRDPRELTVVSTGIPKCVVPGVLLTTARGAAKRLSKRGAAERSVAHGEDALLVTPGGHA